MNVLQEALNPLAADLLESTRWLRITNLLAVFGILVAVVSAFTRRRLAAHDAAPRQPLPAKLLFIVLVLACATGTYSVANRWSEVNHFPSQTMSEVLVMFTLGLLYAMIAVHFAMGLHRMGHGKAILDDVLTLLMLGTVLGVNVYQSTLSTGQRDLPPALQSYWFPFHLSALMIGYSTLSIAALLCLKWFAIRFWTGLRTGEGKIMGTQLLVLVGLGAVWALGGLGITTAFSGIEDPVVRLTSIVVSVLVLMVASLKLAQLKFGFAFTGGGPTAQLMLIAALALTPLMGRAGLYVMVLIGIVLVVALFVMRSAGAERLAAVEADIDKASFRAFSVGFPFLTGGLWMGAFWAQEAWANYWGWDSKENTALITWLVYVIYVHLRMLGGYRGQKAMGVLFGGALSILITFQLFGFLPDSQKSMHRYTDDGVEPREGQVDVRVDESARLPEAEAASEQSR